MPPRKPKQKSAKHKGRKPRPSSSASFASSTSSTPSHVGPAFEKLVAVMSRLRAPGGCPWDREQTHATLRTYLIEEAYEVLDALDSTDDAKFAEELGDLLLQVLFHAQIAHEERRFSIHDVIREIYEKMIRRHPHVFGDKRAKDAAEVLRNWEIIKTQERQEKQAREVIELKETKGKKGSGTSSASFNSSTSSTSLLDDVPRALPALLEAFQLTRKAASIGFDWHDVDGIFAKLDEETRELRHALASATAGLQTDDLVTQGKPARRSSSEAGSIESELGDILFVVVNLARFLNLDPELALKKSNAKFSRRFREMESVAREQGTALAKIPRPQMESLWDQAKLRESPEHSPAPSK
jgi:MazG family protein